MVLLVLLGQLMVEICWDWQIQASCHGENMQIKPTCVKLVSDMKISEISRTKKLIKSNIAFD